MIVLCLCVGASMALAGYALGYRQGATRAYRACDDACQRSWSLAASEQTRRRALETELFALRCRTYQEVGRLAYLRVEAQLGMHN